jgi:hypothetical protein
MTPQAVLQRIVSLFPDFAACWDDPGNCFREDDGSFTHCGVFAEFSAFFRERYQELDPDRVAALGAFVSTSVSSPDAELGNAAATCFLENIAGNRFIPDFKQHLHGQALHYYLLWDCPFPPRGVTSKRKPKTIHWEPPEGFPDLTGLSLLARLAVALHLFHGYCNVRRLVHPEIDRYLDHLWKFIGLSHSGGEFDWWVENQPDLIYTGLGHEYPVGFDELLATAGVQESEFRNVVCWTTEVLYGSMYAACDEDGSRKDLYTLATIVVPLGVRWPDLDRFAGSRWADEHGWGVRPSAEQLVAWRAPATSTRT